MEARRIADSRSLPRSDRTKLRAYAGSVAAIAVATIVGLGAFAYIDTAELAMLYLVAVMLASLQGRGPSLVAASLAVVAFNFCFIPPRFTFAVADARHVITFAVMFVAGLVISTLVHRLRRQEQDAITREQRTARMLAFTREVAAADSGAEVATVLTRHLEQTLDVTAKVIVADLHRERADEGSVVPPNSHALAIPLVAGDDTVGELAIVDTRATPRQLDVDQRQLIDALARQAALAIAHVQYAAAAREADVRARAEELRSSLLSAVSHDLRTPLAVITGAATSLVQHGDTLSAAARTDLLHSIVEDATRLERVLTNLLQLTRVETGLEPAREWVPAEEIIGAALTRTEDIRRGARVETDVAADLVLSIDPVLFEQVLINLIENATKHGAPPFTVSARRSGGDVVIELADRGPGLPAGDEARLFEKFARASTAPGAGLGLAVVRAIVQAHGGSVSAENRLGGGAVFRIVLPAPSPPATGLPAAERVAS
jgi:two-component system sensor histidine kinase KdpD